ncbi:MAG TPA: dihydrodipicolinate synthase family protein [Spirochaetales bacterium]|nr:dihydrodipicolinate synthase family protein [Spirochaetales bacterium]HRY55694.1 dihydrodipicolinate synthase family protein [Spirochaetia bacterium]HRZ64428.1 dihydrodipicolinate synthase family protein [Spirochaetia bacterium]
MERFGGVYAAMLTPFGEGGAPSPSRAEAYCRYLVEGGADGLFPFGTTGEWPLLSEQERSAGVEAVVAAVRALGAGDGGTGRAAKVVVHAGAHSTAATARLAAAAREAGADAVAAICPPYYPLDDEALLSHFAAVAREARGLPVFVYSIPSLTKSDMSPALLARLCRAAPGIAGLKYSGDDLARFREYRRVMGRSFAIFMGDDSLALAALREGADGIVSGNASAVPEIPARLFAAFSAGDAAGAEGAQADLDRFIAAMDPSAELSCFKAVVAERGVEVGEARAPLKSLDAAGRRRVSALVRDLESSGALRRYA